MKKLILGGVSVTAFLFFTMWRISGITRYHQSGWSRKPGIAVVFFLNVLLLYKIDKAVPYLLDGLSVIFQVIEIVIKASKICPRNEKKDFYRNLSLSRKMSRFPRKNRSFYDLRVQPGSLTILLRIEDLPA